MNKAELIKRLESFNLPKEEFVVLSGGSLLMRGLREKTSDIDLAMIKKASQRY